MIKLEYLDTIFKSKLKCKVLAYCILDPSCSVEIALKIYGNVKNYQDRNVSKILNDLRNNGLVEEVDYVKYGVNKYCDRKRAKHFYMTDEVFENLVKEVGKRLTGTRKLNPQVKILLNTMLKNRKAFINSMDKSMPYKSSLL